MDPINQSIIGIKINGPVSMKPSHLSFEFFPPRTPEGLEKLQGVAEQLLSFNPDCFTVTFGAGGSTRQKTLETVNLVQSKTNKPIAAHLSCIDSTRENILALCQSYLASGVSHLVCLRGDVPSGMGSQEVGELKYANELVSFIKENFNNKFHIAIAAYPEYHPQSVSPEQDFLNFKNKAQAGADCAYTQYFYNPDAYFYFLDQCQKHEINIPIIPGIMPILNFSQIARFSDACGAEIPRWIRKRLEKFDENNPRDLESLRSFGQEMVSKLCEKLIQGGAPGLHFYTMNQYAATAGILEIYNFDRNCV